MSAHSRITHCACLLFGRPLSQRPARSMLSPCNGTEVRSQRRIHWYILHLPTQHPPPHTARRHWSLLILPVRSPCYGHAELPQRMCHMAGEDNVSSATVLCLSSHTCCARTHPHTQHYHVKTARHSRWEHAREHQNCIRSPWAFSPCRASCCHASEQLDVCLWSAVTTIMPRQKAPAMRDTIKPPPPLPPMPRLVSVQCITQCLASLLPRASRALHQRPHESLPRTM